MLRTRLSRTRMQILFRFVPFFPRGRFFHLGFCNMQFEDARDPTSHDQMPFTSEGLEIRTIRCYVYWMLVEIMKLDRFNDFSMKLIATCIWFHLFVIKRLSSITRDCWMNLILQCVKRTASNTGVVAWTTGEYLLLYNNHWKAGKHRFSDWLRFKIGYWAVSPARLSKWWNPQIVSSLWHV